MRLLELHIDGFGKFHNRTFTFLDGLNIICGDNEAGKSTLHAFIRGILFGIDKQRGRPSKHDLYTKYEPWSGGAYQGYIRLESGGSIYRVERVFQKESRSLRLIDETAGCSLEPANEHLARITDGLTEASFINTISIGQLKSATDGAMAEELRDRLANLNTSGSVSISTAKACDYLKKKKRTLEAAIDLEAPKTCQSLRSQVQALELDLSAAGQQNKLPALLAHREKLKQGIKKTQQKRKDMVESSLLLQQKMNRYDLASSAGISTMVHDVQAAYEDYLDCGQFCTSKANTTFSLICFLGSIGFLVISKLFERQQQIWMAGLFIAAALLSFCIGNHLFKKKRRTKAAMAKARETIIGTLSRFQADTEPTTENLNQFYQTVESIQNNSLEAKQLADSAESLLHDMERLQGELNQLSAEIEAGQHLQWEMEKKLEQLSEYKNRLEGLKNVLASNQRLQQETEAISLAITTIQNLAASVQNSFGYYLNTSASLFIEEITGGAYNSISVDTSLNVFLNTPSRLIPVEQVSAGTIDQVYLALRLAIAKFLWPDQAMPLLFDDSFALYDDSRLKATLSFIKKSYGGQLLLFTCHQREKRLLADANMIEI